MKRHYNLYKLILMLVVYASTITILGSCSLDEELKGSVAAETVIKSDADVPYLMNGIYSQMQGYGAFKAAFMQLRFFAGDDIGTHQNFANTTKFMNRSITSSDGVLTSAWQSMWQVIEQINSAIKVLDNSKDKISENLYLKSVAELRFLRGYNYFEMVRVWGELPVKLTPSNLPVSSFYESRQPVDKIYAGIIFPDLEAGLAMKPKAEQPTNELGRATKGAAQATLAIANLTYGNLIDLGTVTIGNSKDYYQSALDYANAVLADPSYGLLDNFADLWDVAKEKEAYREVIWSITFTRDKLTANAASKGSEFANYAQPSRRRGVTGNAPLRTGTGSMRVQPWFVNKYITGDYASGDWWTSTLADIDKVVVDYRTEKSFLWEYIGYAPADAEAKIPATYVTYPSRKARSGNANIAGSVVTDPTGILTYLNKYIDGDGLDARNHENDLYVTRLAEIYLIKAEAINELSGPTAEAVDAFNEVRKRARKANGTLRTVPVDMTLNKAGDKASFRMIIFDERGLELVGESSRWFDALRTRYQDQKVSMYQWRLETYYPTVLTAAENALPSWVGGTRKYNGIVAKFSQTAWSDRYKLYPIPDSEMLNNPKFGDQNNGW